MLITMQLYVEFTFKNIYFVKTKAKQKCAVCVCVYLHDYGMGLHALQYLRLLKDFYKNRTTKYISYSDMVELLKMNYISRLLTSVITKVKSTTYISH